MHASINLLIIYFCRIFSPGRPSGDIYSIKPTRATVEVNWKSRAETILRIIWDNKLWLPSLEFSLIIEPSGVRVHWPNAASVSCLRSLFTLISLAYLPCSEINLIVDSRCTRCDAVHAAGCCLSQSVCYPVVARSTLNDCVHTTRTSWPADFTYDVVALQSFTDWPVRIRAFMQISTV